jgi:hypothetical protein
MAWTYQRNAQNKFTKKGIRIKFEAKWHMGRHKTKWFSQILEDIKMKGKNWQNK